MLSDGSPNRLRRVALVALVLGAVSLGVWAMLPGPAPGAAPGSLPGDAVAKLPLCEASRVYLAEIEHRGLTLTRKGFPAIAAAIRAGDARAVAKFLAPAFRGETLAPELGAGPASAELTVRRATADAPSRPAPVSVDANGFAAHLVELRGAFAADARVGLALMSLSPRSRDALDGPYTGSAEMRVVGRLAAGGVGELVEKLEFELTTVPDVDVVATQAGWILALRAVVAQKAVASHDLMAEVAKERGIDRALFQDNWTVPHLQRPIVTGGLFLADVDDDGRQDILVTDMNGLFLFRGLEGGRFEDVTIRAGLPRELKAVSAAAFGDFDHDGRVDLILPNHAFRNLGDFRFQDISAQVGLHLDEMGNFSVGDYNGDGRLDLYVTRRNGPKTERESHSSWIDGPGGPGNQLWHNLGDWAFRDVSVPANATAGHRSAFAAAWLDVDENGWPDIYVINEFGGGVLLVNDGHGAFVEHALVDDAGDFGSMGLAAADVDNDGHIDIYTANMYSKAGRRIMENLPEGSYGPDVVTKMKRFVTGSELYRNRGGLRFERVGKALRVHAVGWAYGATFLDLDNDGFLDLYGTAGFVSAGKEEPDG